MLRSEDVDLNRDFPDPLLLGTTGLQPTGIEQPETLALMQWMSETHFVASASLHEVGSTACPEFWQTSRQTKDLSLSTVDTCTISSCSISPVEECIMYR